MLQNGQHFTLDNDPTPGDATRVHLPHPEILSALEVAMSSSSMTASSGCA